MRTHGHAHRLQCKATCCALDRVGLTFDVIDVSEKGPRPHLGGCTC